MYETRPPIRYIDYYTIIVAIYICNRNSKTHNIIYVYLHIMNVYQHLLEYDEKPHLRRGHPKAHLVFGT